LLSKLLLGLLVTFLVAKLGLRAALRTKLRELKPKLDRGVNLMIAGLALVYLAHLVLWLARQP
jgi:hypothetical protein